jgi:hypothetical protein
MARQRLTIYRTDGTESVLNHCRRIFTEDGVLKAVVEANSYCDRIEGFPLSGIEHYTVEEQ